MKRTLIWIAIGAALAVPMTALAQQPQPPKSPAPTAAPPSQPIAVPASKLIGKDVFNARGEDLGEVQDLAVDIRNNRIYYALLDMQGKFFAYPLSVLGWSDDREKVVLDVSEQVLERAPGMPRSTYEARMRGMSVHGVPAGDDYTAYWNDVAAFWREHRAIDVQPRPGMHLVWGSKLLGWNVQDRNGRMIGEIQELVIDPRDGAVRFAAVDFNERLGDREGKPWNEMLHPLPLDAFEARGGLDNLVMNTGRDQLQPARSFTEDELKQGLRDQAFIEQAARYADQLTPTVAAAGAR